MLRSFAITLTAAAALSLDHQSIPHQKEPTNLAEVAGSALQFTAPIRIVEGTDWKWLKTVADCDNNQLHYGGYEKDLTEWHFHDVPGKDMKVFYIENKWKQIHNCPKRFLSYMGCEEGSLDNVDLWEFVHQEFRVTWTGK